MTAMNDQIIEFIREQSMFFVGTAAPRGRVNVSPKGMDTLRVVGPDHVRWLNLSGSGNETAAHIGVNGRMTLMFCSFTEVPLIVRLYGTATVLHPRDPGWDKAVADFPELGGSRQIFDLRVDHVSTSCGTGVPMMTLDSVRADDELEPFYAAMSADELQNYWASKNVRSIDGLATGIFEDSPEPVGTLDVLALDCTDAQEMAEFYRSLLGGDIVTHPHGGWVELHTATGDLAFQEVAGHRPPTWPDGETPQQAHLDIRVTDLDVAERAATARGAVKHDVQPSPNNFRVFVDPAGHPFCLVLSWAEQLG